jgi:hypothetical protein
MKLYKLIAISLSTLTLYSCSGTPLKSSVLPKLPQKSAWQKDEGFQGSDVLFPKQTITSKYDVRKPDKVTAAQLDAVFKGVLAGKGEVFLKIAKKHGICPRFYAALVCHESAFGTSLYARRYANVAGRMSKGGRGPMKFKNVEECLDSTAAHLQKNYIGQGRTSLMAIQQKYCPTSGKVSNDPRGKNKYWLTGIQSLMSKI